VDFVTWDQITAECDGYRAGIVAVFRKYEGMPTDKKDSQGRPIVVSANSFAGYVVFAPVWAEPVGKWARPYTRRGRRGRGET
jgi:hypothetical protein